MEGRDVCIDLIDICIREGRDVCIDLIDIYFAFNGGIIESISICDG
jgi:hypothetical protein